MRLSKINVLGCGFVLALAIALVCVLFPDRKSPRLENAGGPFRITASNGMTERTYVGNGPVQFAGNAICFTDHIGVRHRISGGMVIFDRYDSTGHVAYELFNALRAPVIFDKAFADSLEREEAKAWTKKRSPRQSSARRRRGTK